MKTLIIAFLLSGPPAVDMTTVRELFAVASIDEEANEKLIKLTSGYTVDYAPVLFAYYGGALTTMANHCYWPSTKLDYFNKGKDKIELAISKYPGNVEIRFVRYSVQRGCPFFLGYSDDLEKDKKFILSHINETDWTPAYKQEVKNYLFE